MGREREALYAHGPSSLENQYSSPPSSSYSPSSSAEASWYCWYSETRSFMLDSASVNSISSMPSPVYQCRKALRRNIEVNCSATRFITSCMQVELPQKPTDILRPLGGMSHMAHFMLFGIHSTKYDEFLFCTLSICSVSSGTVGARYCCEPRDVSGAKPIMKKCKRGKGIMLTASLRRSQLS